MRPGAVLVTMRDANNPYALKWALARTRTDQQDIVVLTARMMGAGGPEYVENQIFSDHEQMLFTKAVSVAESSVPSVRAIISCASAGSAAACMPA